MVNGALLAAVILVGLLGGVNLVFTYGVVRRLREHTRLINSGAVGGGVPMVAHPAAGTAIPDFTATTTDGATVTAADISSGRYYIGFFSTTCPPCRERLPEFLRLATEQDPRRFLVVISGDETEARVLVGQLDSRIRLILEPPGGPLTTTFGISRSPTMLAIEDGTVVANAATLGQLPLPVPA